MTALFYDTETSGLLDSSLSLDHPRQCRIVQIGAILDDNDRNEIMRLDAIIALSTPISAKAIEIHGITLEMSQALGLNETNVMECFLDMVDVADIIVGQNVIGFDNKVVNAVVRRIHQDPEADPFEDKEIFDTMLAAQPICRIQSKNGGIKKPNLTEIHTHFFGKGFDKAHSAINDVMAARRCFYALQDLVKK